MRFIRLIERRHIFACGLAAAGVLLGSAPGSTAEQFPFDQTLLLDAAPLRPGKRMPMITVEANGTATIDLWCKSVSARVELSDAAIKIEPAALPDALPEMMSNAQCTPQRIQADQDLLAAFAQVTAWHSQGSGLVLDGPSPMKFRPASN